MRLPSALLVVAIALPQVAAAAGPSRVSWAGDGALTAGTFAAALLLGLVPVDATHTWSSELLPIDDGVKVNFSKAAARTSDALIVVVVAAPMAAELGLDDHRELGRTALIYGETLGATVLLNAAAKVLVQRPRPYVYSDDPQVQRWAEAQGAESRLSFYSGHSTVSFAAAVGGAYLFAVHSSDEKTRAAFWGVELMLATATANLRVRAGKHFYSDVLLGAVVGAGLGVAVPLLHQRDRGRYTPTPIEWLAMGGGIVVGALASEVLPFGADVAQPADGPPAMSFGLSPMVVEHGTGLALVGAF